MTRPQKYHSEEEYRHAENERLRKCDLKFKRKFGVGRKQYARISLIGMLGGECSTCGFRDVRALQLDHIDGSGAADRRRFKNIGVTYYHYYLKNIEEAHQKLQVLCANCNWIKRDINNETSRVKLD